MTVSNASGQHTLRERNLALVAQEIFTSDAPISRATVSARTGLTRATVSSLVDLLVDSQLVAELPPVVSKKAGRPAIPLVPATGTFFGIGLEVNGHYLGGTIVDLSGTEHGQIIVEGDFQGSNPDEVMNQLAEIAVSLVRTATTSVLTPGRSRPVIAGVNIALPGLIDPNRSVLRVAPNLGWHDLNPVNTEPISEALHLRTGHNVTIGIGNEANFGGLAQVALANLTTFLYVSAEVGIGSAIVQDSAVFLGRRGWSGELGHLTIDPSGPECSCGSRGCLEQYAGLLAILRNAGLDDDTPATTLVARVQDGDAAAIAAVETAGEALGRALADYVNLIDIHMIVLGGFFHPLADLLIPIVTKSLVTHVVAAPWAQFNVLPAPVGVSSAMIGAATSVMRAVYLNPAPWLEEARGY